MTAHATIEAKQHRSASSAIRVSCDRELPLDRFQLMGVLNVTPDSFSDGGRFADMQVATARALHMADEGASIIDVGGESTRPGAARIATDEQIARVIPVITAVRERSDVLISIDTTRSEVARAALDAGANIINDVAAGDESDDMFALAAERGCGLVLMHRRLPPDKDSFSDKYDRPPRFANVVVEVRDWLLQRVERANAAGVSQGQIVIDPGLGFGKSVEQNYELIAGARQLMEAGFPVLCAASRKSFIGAVSGEAQPDRRVPGSLAIAVMMYERGVRLFRVHDVAEHRQALAAVEAVSGASQE